MPNPVPTSTTSMEKASLAAGRGRGNDAGPSPRDEALRPVEDDALMKRLQMAHVALGIHRDNKSLLSSGFI
jgi:hypothetical protein